MEHLKASSIPYRPAVAARATSIVSPRTSVLPQRLILLLGTARSGTSWLGTALSSYANVLYSHEPLSRLRTPQILELVSQIKNTGFLTPPERRALLREWCEADPECRRPPFFRKGFFHMPPSLQALAWLWVRRTGCGAAWYRRWFTPPLGGAYDLLIKEVDWATHCAAIVRALHPELVIVLRHPCAVVASLIRGQRLGLMPRIEAARWYAEHQWACGQLGFPRPAVLHMKACELLALNWLVQNWTYQTVLRTRRRGLLVVYEKLCRDPLEGLQGIFEYLDWEMGPATRVFLEKSQREGTPWWRGLLQPRRASYFGVVRRRRDVVDSWKTDLTAGEQEQVLAITRCLPDFEAYWPATTGVEEPPQPEEASTLESPRG